MENDSKSINNMRAVIVALAQMVILSLYSYVWFTNTPYSVSWLHVFYPIAIVSIMFPVNYVINNIINIFYPVKWVSCNNKYYMYKPVRFSSVYPNITIIIPIYKEDFFKVIMPTLESAIMTRSVYKGRCNIVVLDDGYQFQTHEMQSFKLMYYKYLNIGMVARPKSPRPGKFKKASNLNNHLRCLNDLHTTDSVISGDIKMNEYFVLIDSDSRIDHLKINDIVSSIHSNSNIGYIQFHTLPLDNSYENFFSRQIAQFTKNLYNLVFIVVTVGGEPAPLVGHNAIIRTSALQSVKGQAKNPSRDIWWSEDKVSEDFDFAFRSMANGYYGVYGVFATFQEGISFELHSELLKMSKFSYGAMEMLCSKAYGKYWLTRNAPWSAKINITSYMFSYLALAIAPIMAMVQLVVSCYVDNLYEITLDPVILMAISFVIFSIIGPISTWITLNRISNIQGLENYRTTFKDQFTLGLFMTAFYTGSLYWYILGIIGNRSWGSTKKEHGKIKVWATYRHHYIATIIYTLGVILALTLGCGNWYGALPSIIMVVMHLVIPMLWRGSSDKGDNTGYMLV